jgi:hypothetical protein
MDCGTARSSVVVREVAGVVEAALMSKWNTSALTVPAMWAILYTFKDYRTDYADMHTQPRPECDRIER